MPQAAMPYISAGISGVSSIFGGRSSSQTTASPIFGPQSAQFLEALFGAQGGGGKGLFGDASSTMSGMLKTGMPTDVGPAWEAMKNASGKQVAEGRANLLESYGSMGARTGSGMINALSDYESQTNKDFLSILANYTMQAQEAAKGRQMSAGQMIMGMGHEVGTAMTGTVTNTSRGSVPGGIMSGINSGMQSMYLNNLMNSSPNISSFAPDAPINLADWAGPGM